MESQSIYLAPNFSRPRYLSDFLTRPQMCAPIGVMICSDGQSRVDGVGQSSDFTNVVVVYLN